VTEAAAPRPGLRSALRALLPPIGRRAWLVVAANGLSLVGSGLTMPFLIVYLHDVRGIGLAAAGTALGAIGVATLVATPSAGTFIDRVGAPPALAIGLVAGGLGIGGFIFVDSALEALGPALVFGAAGALMRSGFTALIAEIVEPALRSAVFGVDYAFVNLGMGTGALLAGLIVDVDEPGTFVKVFVADVVSYFLFAAILLALLSEKMRPGRTRQDAAPESLPRPRAGYRVVLADRGLVAASVVNTLLATFAFSQLLSGYPAWATGPAGSSTTIIGIAFAVNTSLIVVAQLFVLRLVVGRRRTRATALASVIFAAAWLVAVAAGPAEGLFVAAALVGALAIFAFGEMVLSPALHPLVNDLAPDELRGRYNAVFNLSWAIGPIVGPAVAGAALAYGLGSGFFIALSAACCASAVLAVRLERFVSEQVNVGHAETSTA
jgi:MFS family permease